MEGVLTFALADVKANIEVGLEKDGQPCFLPALKHHAGYREQKNAGGPGQSNHQMHWTERSITLLFRALVLAEEA